MWEHIIDEEERQLVKYTTEKESETLLSIARAFGLRKLPLADAHEVGAIGEKSALGKGRILKFDVPEELLWCSSCGNLVHDDELIICEAACSRAYCLGCLSMDEVPDAEWYCNYCSSSPRAEEEEEHALSPGGSRRLEPPQLNASKYCEGTVKRGSEDTLWEVTWKWENLKKGVHGVTGGQRRFYWKLKKEVASRDWAQHRCKSSRKFFQGEILNDRKSTGYEGVEYGPFSPKVPREKTCTERIHDRMIGCLESPERTAHAYVRHAKHHAASAHSSASAPSPQPKPSSPSTSKSAAAQTCTPKTGTAHSSAPAPISAKTATSKRMRAAISPISATPDGKRKPASVKAECYNRESSEGARATKRTAVRPSNGAASPPHAAAGTATPAQRLAKLEQHLGVTDTESIAPLMRISKLEEMLGLTPASPSLLSRIQALENQALEDGW